MFKVFYCNYKITICIISKEKQKICLIHFCEYDESIKITLLFFPPDFSVLSRKLVFFTEVCKYTVGNKLDFGSDNVDLPKESIQLELNQQSRILHRP